MKTLFSFDAHHTYFGPGGGAAVQFVPTRRSQHLAAKAGVRFFYRESGVRACFDPVDFQKLNAYADDPVEPLALTFRVVAKRGDFYNFTVLPEVPEGQLLVGTLRDGGLDPSLCSDTAPEKASLWEASRLVAEGICSGEELAFPPVALLHLDYSGKRGRDILSGALDDTPQAYALRFEARKTIWRYFIACDANPERLVVEDPDGHVSFGPAGMLKADGHRDYARFISDKPLALRWKGRGRFQLKCRGDGRSRTLLKALPNAPSDPLHGMDTDSGRVFVSDIFVNHYVYGR